MTVLITTNTKKVYQTRHRLHTHHQTTFMPRKREREEDTEVETERSEPTKKKSKKERLQEARAKAKQWALEKKAKSAVKKTKSKATSAETRVIKTKSPAKNRSETKTRQVEAEEEEDKGTDSAEVSKKERRREARARARAWYDGKAFDEGSVTPTKRPTEQASKAEDVRMDEAEEDDDDQEMEEAEAQPPIAQPQPSTNSNGAHWIPQEPQPGPHQQSHAAVQQPVVPSTAQPIPPETAPSSADEVADPVVSGKSPRHRIAAAPHLPAQAQSPQQVKPPANQTPYPVVQAPAKAELHVQDQEQERLHLEKRIQDQVMANALAPVEQPQPSSYPERSGTSGRRPFLTLLGQVLLVLVAVAAGVALNERLGEMASSKTGVDRPCFIDSADPFQEDYFEGEESPFECENRWADVEESPHPSCNEALDPIPCPEFGECCGGYLQSCTSAIREPSESLDECVLTAAAKASLSDVEASLVKWTIQHYCTPDGCEFAKETFGEALLFPSSVLVEQGMAVDHHLLEESGMVVTSWEDNELMVGLSDDYVKNQLDFPLGCWLALCLLSAATLGIEVARSSLASITGSLWSLTLAHPIASFLSLITLWLIRVYRRRRSRREALRRDTAKVKHMAYEELMSDSLEHVVLHIRDGVAHDLHPNSSKDRQHIIKKVWPRVVADIRSDNRVLKTNTIIQGHPRDVWQWVATPSKGRRVGIRIAGE